ncbi:MAG: hypothetical protein QOD34_2166, partial [Mycobacterium sp.]|nr:hypothetical protein [Mycobacterium sp.]
ESGEAPAHVSLNQRGSAGDEHDQGDEQ